MTTPAQTRFDLPDGGGLVLTDPQGDRCPGVIRRLDADGRVLWSGAADDEDLFIDVELAGDAVVATSWRGQSWRIALVDGVVLSRTFVK